MNYQEEKEELLKKYKINYLEQDGELFEGIYIDDNLFLSLQEGQEKNFRTNIIQKGYEPFDGQYNFLQNAEFSKEELIENINLVQSNLSKGITVPIENANVSMSEEDFDVDLNADWKDAGTKFKDLKLLGFEKLPMSYSYKQEVLISSGQWQEDKRTQKNTENNVLYAKDENSEKIYKIQAFTQIKQISVTNADYSVKHGIFEIEEINEESLPNIQYKPKEDINISIYETEEMATTKRLIEGKISEEEKNILELKTNFNGDYFSSEGYTEFNFDNEHFIENKERTIEINSKEPYIDKRIFDDEEKIQKILEEERQKKEEKEKEKEKEENEERIRKEAEEEIKNSLSPFEKFKEAMFHNVIGDRIDKLVDERMNELYGEEKDDEKTYNLPVFDKNKEKEIATENDNNIELEC